MLVIRHGLSFGLNYLYCGRPHFDDISPNAFLDGAQKIAAREKSIFLKIDPAENIFFDAMRPRITSGVPLQPQETILLDLSQSEDELLRAMHEKTRYNIRLAERKGVEIVQSLGGGKEKDFEVFWKLLAETSGRNQFSLHEKRYYQALLGEQSDYFSTDLFFAIHGGDRGAVRAAAMINFYRDPRTGKATATYLHGGSSREQKKLMAPHLLHWRIIEEAKKRGMAYYDLWGIDEQRWPGVTRFKKGFGGKHTAYPPSAHIIYRSLLYKMYEIGKHIKQ